MKFTDQNHQIICLRSETIISIHLKIYLPTKYFLNTHYVPDTNLFASNITLNKTENSPYHQKA